jgi:hypothetical protein
VPPGRRPSRGLGLLGRRLHCRRPQHHRLLEICCRRGRLRALLLDELQLVLAEFDDIVVLQEMLLHGIAVDQGAIGAAQVFHEGIVQDRDDDGVLAANRQVVDLDVVVRLAADGGAFLGERDLLQNQAIHAEYQFRHRRSLTLF